MHGGVSMTEKMEDRRIRRTKRLLKQGFAELMREKDFQEITVRDITDRMDLNRGTFYLHYADTYDLLQKLESDVLDDVQRMIDEHSSEAGTGSLQPVDVYKRQNGHPSRWYAGNAQPE